MPQHVKGGQNFYEICWMRHPVVYPAFMVPFRRGRKQLPIIGDIDTLVAAAAIERHLTLLTTDSDFTRVPGLQYQLIARASLR